MKSKIQLFVIALTFIFFAACQGTSSDTESEAEIEKTETTDVPDTEPVEEEASDNAVIYTIDPSVSLIEWEGTKKFINFSHTGTLQFKSGNVGVEDGKLTSASFVVDMTTLDNDDLKGRDSYDNLVGHLKSDDFFSVDTYPESSFMLTSIQENENADGFTHTATGKLTIKDITKDVSFPLNIKLDENNFKANAALVFDRTDFGAKYGSDDFFDVVKDKAIKNEVKINLRIKATTETM